MYAGWFWRARTGGWRGWMGYRVGVLQGGEFCEADSTSSNRGSVTVLDSSPFMILQGNRFMLKNWYRGSAQNKSICAGGFGHIVLCGRGR